LTARIGHEALGFNEVRLRLVELRAAYLEVILRDAKTLHRRLALERHPDTPRHSRSYTSVLGLWKCASCASRQTRLPHTCTLTFPPLSMQQSEHAMTVSSPQTVHGAVVNGHSCDP